MVTYYHNKKNHKDRLIKKEQVEGSDPLKITERGENEEKGEKGEKESKKRHADKEGREEPDGKKRRSARGNYYYYLLGFIIFVHY